MKMRSINQYKELVPILLHKILNLCRLRHYLDQAKIILVIYEKFGLINIEHPHKLIMFVGNYGGLSILFGDYYFNLDNVIYYCNYKKYFTKNNFNYFNICENDRGTKLIPLSLLESVLLEGSKDKVISFQISKMEIRNNNFKLATIKSEGSNKTLSFEKSGNFFHFYFETISHILKNLSADTNISFLVGPQQFYLDILEYYGINYVIATKDNTLKRYAGNYSKIYPSTNDIKFLHSYNRQHFNMPKRTSPTRLYITRRNEKQRRIINEDRLIDQLVAYGFLIVDPGEHSYADQVKMFRSAEIIVGAHGAAFSNLVWCNKSVKVIELNGNKDVRWHFAKISLTLNFEYKLFIGTTVDDIYFQIDEKKIINYINHIIKY